MRLFTDTYRNTCLIGITESGRAHAQADSPQLHQNMLKYDSKPFFNWNIWQNIPTHAMDGPLLSKLQNPELSNMLL